MSELITLQTCFLIVGNVLAQDPRVYTESDGKGGVKIMAEKKKPGTVTVEVSFTELNGFGYQAAIRSCKPLIQPSAILEAWPGNQMALVLVTGIVINFIQGKIC